ncbi:MAG: uroporphyrinogen-III C-methyltransferase, partial [Thiothrix sp.]
AAGYKHWQRMNDKVRDSLAEIQTLQQRLQQMPSASTVDELRQELVTRTDKLNSASEQAQQEVARMLNQTRQFADTVAAQVEQVTFLQAKIQQVTQLPSSTEWQVEEVRYLLQVANRQLHIEQNVRAAIAALKEADALLAQNAAVAYLPVRQQLGRDIASLEAVALPDIAGLAQRIQARLLSLKPLPAIDTQVGSSEQVKLSSTEDTPRDDSWFADYQQKLLRAFDAAVVVRRHDQPIQVALDAETRQRLFQLIHLRLETLRLLLLQRDTDGFREQLGLIREAVQTYYPAAQAEAFLAELDELAKVELQPTLPDISGSFKQLESARQAELDAAQASKSADKANTAIHSKAEGKAELKTTGKTDTKQEDKSEGNADSKTNAKSKTEGKPE